ncbi:hypothetical protein M407DRAFT_32373 [Tulasnella calospora MUT 4182]|uniref:Uncharacterized protein n=1 Tax=Tulasnella calospora MUT 4182 TaxID=1051891 RepID=A0A0C3Q4V7_9AGAM|nr:hypothetical protein M407DRAFT_32373 [Tulasnella calospora MUT 4182]
MTWAVAAFQHRLHFPSYGLITRSSTSTNFGTQWSTTWSVSGDSNRVTSLLQADGTQCDAKFIVHGQSSGMAIWIPADIQSFLAVYKNFTPVTLHFERMS